MIDKGLMTFTMYIGVGVLIGFIYELKKKLVLSGIVGASGIYGVAVFAGISFPQLEGYLNMLAQWVQRMGTGGLGLPIGTIVGQSLANRLT